MIAVVLGTTGELIKLAPVLRRLEGEYVLATTAQQVTQIEPFLAELGLRPPDIWLARGAGGRDLESSGDVPRWLADVASGFHAHRRRLRQADVVVVHGDTMTTLLGALMGRALRRPVAHIEAGLRSGDLRNPFPEEAVRRVTSRLARVHYAPGPRAAATVARRGRVIDTQWNTIRDALELVPDEPPPLELPKEPFGVVSLHRFELINDRRLFAATLDRLAASPYPLLFVDHPVTAAALARFGLQAPGRIPRQRFFGWVQLLRRASFVVSDSGGAQEECYFLNVPCLVHRRRSERVEGFGETTLLSQLDVRVLESFLRDVPDLQRGGPVPAGSPSDLIVRDLLDRFPS